MTPAARDAVRHFDGTARISMCVAPVPSRSASRHSTARSTRRARPPSCRASAGATYSLGSRPYSDQSSGFGSVYSPSTVPSTRVELHEAADRRRFVGAVEQDAPRRASAQPAARELRGRVPDREADRAARNRERLGLVDVQRPRGEEVVAADARRAGRRQQRRPTLLLSAGRQRDTAPPGPGRSCRRCGAG